MNHKHHRIALFLLCLFTIGFSACTDDGISGIDRVIIDNPENPYKFRELLLVVHLINANGNYVVLDQIDSIKLNVNGQLWGAFTSSTLDTSGLITRVEDNQNVTEQELGYLVMAQYSVEKQDLITAGEYANHLRDRRTLAPGDHVAEITEIQFRDGAGSTVILQPRMYAPFTLEENRASVFLGNITISVN